MAKEEGEEALRAAELTSESQASHICETYWMLVAAGFCMYEQQRMIAGKCTYCCALHVLLALHAAT
jgi:hypothetical protein